MSAILVVETNSSYADSLREALEWAGLSVETCDEIDAAIRLAEAAPPRLVIACSTLPDVRSFLGAFRRSRGGPGAVATVPAAIAGKTGADAYDADALLGKPCSSEEVWRVILPLVSDPSGGESRQLSSSEIFGDVLAEVEAEAEAEQNHQDADPSSAAPASVRPVPPPSPAGTAASPAGKTSRGPSENLERRLEETLSGVLSPRPKKKSLEPTGPTTTPAPTPFETMVGIPGSEGQQGDSPFSTTALPRPPDASERELEPSIFATSALPVSPDPAPPATTEDDAELFRFEPPPPLEPDDSGPPSEPSFEAPRAPADSTSDAVDLPSPAAALGVADAFRTQRLPAVPSEPAAPPPPEPPVSESVSEVTEPASELPDAPEGEVFGDYTLLRRIAMGGMAEVWQARRRGVEGFQKTVAIKRILAHLTSSPDFVTMFIDEAKLAAQLNHNNIIQIYDLGKVGNDFYIAMELVDGLDLRSILRMAREKRRPLPLGLALLIASSVARALDFAHRKRDFDNRAMGLVHRDVSPQNVLISHEGEIKLCDFGIAKAAAKASVTQMGALKGKLQYMSPEQAWGRPVDARSDIFSLGSVTFEMLTGEKLFAGESELEVLEAVRDCRVRAPHQTSATVPEEIDPVVLKALAPNPEDRYSTAGELEEELKALLVHLRTLAGQSELARYLKELTAAPEVPEEDEPLAEPAAAVPAPATSAPVEHDEPLEPYDEPLEPYDESLEPYDEPLEPTQDSAITEPMEGATDRLAEGLLESEGLPGDPTAEGGGVHGELERLGPGPEDEDFDPEEIDDQALDEPRDRTMVLLLILLAVLLVAVLVLTFAR